MAFKEKILHWKLTGEPGVSSETIAFHLFVEEVGPNWCNGQRATKTYELMWSICALNQQPLAGAAGDCFTREEGRETE